MCGPGSQLIKMLRNMHVKGASIKARKLGVLIKQTATREEVNRILDSLDPAEIEKRLAQKSQSPPPIPPTQLPKSFELSITLPQSLQSFKNYLYSVHRIYLNQYRSRSMIEPITIEKRKQDDWINEALGVQSEVVFEPKHIKQWYQNDSDTIIQQYFPTLQEKNYINLLQKKNETFVSITAAQKRLLLLFGRDKERRFQMESRDFFEEAIYSPVYYGSIQQLLNSWQQREDYLKTFVPLLPLSLLDILTNRLKSKIIDKRHSYSYIVQFSLFVSHLILQNPYFSQGDPNQIQHSRILSWIYTSLVNFQASMQVNLEASSYEIFLSNLKIYSQVKQLLLSCSFAELLPQRLLMGIGQSEWPKNLVSNIENAVPQVGVSELEGNRVTLKLNSIKDVMEFLKQEDLELPLSLLEKMLLGIRAGIQWKAGEAQKSSEDLFISQLETFFQMDFCFSIIEIIFMNGQVSIDLQSVLVFLWNNFFRAHDLDQPMIKSIYLLVNITIRYKCQQILKNDQRLFELLAKTIDVIQREDYKALRKEEVLEFLKEETTNLFTLQNKQRFLDLLAIKTNPFSFSL